MKICVVYPADPLGVIPGGIDTFIRGVLRWAPDDIEMRVVGITTDVVERPLGKWTLLRLGDRQFHFYPILALQNSEKQAFIPVIARFLLALLRERLPIAADVLEFHRIEPCLAYLRDGRPKTLVMHQNMNVLHNSGSDIRWRHLPNLYFRLEDFLLPRISSVFCVREDAAAAYRERHPELKNRIHFTPTWVDTEIFHPATGEERRQGRALLESEFGFTDDHFVLITVGRLDKQKNPLLLLEAFQQLSRAVPEARLLFVGDGILRRPLEDGIARHGLESAVRLSGVKPASQISRYLQSADAFVLSSAYEGMPMCVLEALGSGLPVVSTDVGEVSRVVHPGVNGERVSNHDAGSLADAMLRCRENLDRYRGDPCWDAVQDYTPQKVLLPIYENYRRLAAQGGNGGPRA